MIISVIHRVQNIVGKGEIAISHNVFKRLFPPEAPKGVIVWEWVKPHLFYTTNKQLFYIVDQDNATRSHPQNTRFSALVSEHRNVNAHHRADVQSMADGQIGRNGRCAQ